MKCSNWVPHQIPQSVLHQIAHVKLHVNFLRDSISSRSVAYKVRLFVGTCQSGPSLGMSNFTLSFQVVKEPILLVSD